MTKKIFKNIFLACFSMLVVTIVIVFGVMYNYHGKQIMNELHSEIDTLSKSEKSRITWVNKDGSIKYDSNVSKSKMENHLNRKEIKDAMKNGTGEDVRMSDTLSERTIYCAKLLSDGSVIRISTNQYTVWICDNCTCTFIYNSLPIFKKDCYAY